QAEDGIRDFHVTGVQTCALPILKDKAMVARTLARLRKDVLQIGRVLGLFELPPNVYLERRRERAAAQRGISREAVEKLIADRARSEERRVGKEDTCGRSTARIQL